MVDEARRPKSRRTAESALTTSPKRAASRLPASLQFPLVLILSVSFSALGYSTLNQWTGAGLSAISRPVEARGEVALLSTWRICELALAWYGNLDSFDVAALSTLSRGPTLYLLTTFYGTNVATALASLSVDVISSFLPFVLLRALSPAHSSSASTVVPNRELVADRAILVYTTLLAGAIYSVTLFTAFSTYLPRVLVLYFEGIPSIEAARSATPSIFVNGPTMLFCLLFGLAARTFIFTPSAVVGATKNDRERQEFDPVSATFGETLYWNLWGYTSRAKVVITRTALIMAVAAVDTYISCTMTISGVESTGALAYAAVWATAAFFTGVGFVVVGDV